MDDLRKNLSSPTSIKGSITKRHSQSVPKQRIRFSEEGKENKYESPNQQHPKKSISKHFMSPTFSGSSKTKKKVMIESNQDYSVWIYTSENVPSIRYPLSPVSVTKPEAEMVAHQVFDEMPATNGLVIPSQVRSVEEEEAEICDFEEDKLDEELEEDEIDEEVEEDKHGMLYKVMKFVVLLCAVFLSTLYISSMNSPTPKTAPLMSLKSQWGYPNETSQACFFQASVNDFGMSSVFLNNTLETDLVLMEATESSILIEAVEHNVVEKLLVKQIEVVDPIYLDAEPHVFEVRGESADEVQSSEVLRSQDLDPSDDVNTNEGPGKYELIVEKEVVTDILDYTVVKTTTPKEERPEDSTSVLRVPAKSEPVSYKIDEQSIILGDILRTCEINVNSLKELCDSQHVEIESTVTDFILAILGIALLAAVLKFCRSCLKPSARGPSPSAQLCVEEGTDLPLVKEDDSVVEKESFVDADYFVNLPASPLSVEPIGVEKDIYLPGFRKDDSFEKKEYFDEADHCTNSPDLLLSVERRLIELSQSQSRMVELLGEYVVPAEFSRSSFRTCSHEINPEDIQQRNWGIPPDSPSYMGDCSASGFSVHARRNPHEEILTKEEVNSATLRRSSRLRNKRVTSPL
ncbi:hypothetical protein ACHQM5_007362 [Ranunculus cassubicifolius]